MGLIDQKKPRALRPRLFLRLADLWIGKSADVDVHWILLT